MPDTPSGPTDDEILARLRATSREQWDALWDAAEAVAALDAPARWEGGRSADGSMQLPYPVYEPAVDRLRSALLTVTGGAIVFSWMDWSGVERYRDGQGLGEAPVADAARLATAVMRSERFTDGSIEGAIRRGTIAAIVSRLRRWRETGA